MKLIVGLGNPGAQYERTRHNAGFLAVDRLVSRFAPGAPARARFQAATWEADLPAPSGPERCMLLKPTTYMTRSGICVGDAVRFYKIDPAADLFVIVDDVYLPSGTIRIRESGSPGGHNGLDDIQRSLGTDRYPRLRIGVDVPGPAPQADYVLGRFTDEQWALVGPAIDRAAEAAALWAASGIAPAMNKFNAPPAPPRAAGTGDPSAPARPRRDTPAKDPTSPAQSRRADSQEGDES